MKAEKIETEVKIPEGTVVEIKPDGVIQVKGPKGELSRRLFHPKINASLEGGEVKFIATKATMREKKMLFTHRSHLRNMVKGVNEGFEYKLKICSGHFPMSVSVKGEKLEVKNFVGESVPRSVKIDPRTKVEVDGVVVTVTGNDVEATGQMAASIELMCRRTGFDRRIFQDGIYITHKDGDEL